MLANLAHPVLAVAEFWVYFLGMSELSFPCLAVTGITGVLIWTEPGQIPSGFVCYALVTVKGYDSESITSRAATLAIDDRRNSLMLPA